MIHRLFRTKTIQSQVGEILNKNTLHFWNGPWLSNPWFFILVVGFGLVEALLIISGNSMIGLGLALLVPALVICTAYPFAVFILWLLVMPFLQNTITDQSRTIYWIVYRAIPPLAVCVTILTNQLRPFQKRLHFKLGTDGLIMILFLGWALVNILTYHRTDFSSYIYTLYDQSFVPFCMYWWIRFSTPTEKDFLRLLPLAIFFVIFEVAVGITSWLWPALLPADWVGTASERTIGTLRFVHAYSLTILFFSFILFQAAMNRESRAKQLIMLSAVGTGLAGIFLSFSRGSWFGGAVAWIGLAFLYPKSVIRISIIVLVVMAILGSTLLVGQIAFAEQRLSSEQTAMVRLVIWDAGMQMIKLKPFFGWGYGDYKTYAGQFQRILYDTAATKEHASHNTFISFAAELGIPGLLLYILPAIWLFILSIRRRKQLPQNGFWSQKLLTIFWLFLLAYCIVIFFSDIRTSTYGLSLWWITLGWIAILIAPYHSNA